MANPEQQSWQKALEVEYLQDIRKLIEEVDIKRIRKIVNVLWDAYKTDASIFFAGNGGSAATASHMAADIAKNTVINSEDDAEKRIKAISLTDNVSWHTASANDLGYRNIFVEQLKNFGREGDVLFLISGSGNSENAVKAAEWSRNNGLTTIGLLAFDGGSLADLSDISLTVDTYDYGLAESVHSVIHHLVVNELMGLKQMEDR